MSEREKLKRRTPPSPPPRPGSSRPGPPSTAPTKARWKARGELEGSTRSRAEGFDDLDDALTAIKGGEAGVLALDKTEPRRAAVTSLEKKIAAYDRAGDLAQQALALREKDADAAARDLDRAARAVVAAEADWPALKQRYADLAAELRKLRAQLGSLAGSVPNMSSPFVAEVDVRDLLWLNPLVGPERDTSFGAWLAALKSDPDATPAPPPATSLRAGVALI